ncbi:FAD dependent oxidoreductase-domain-containing protein [Lyophyllum atratum]|nr:FAD dependent oxidoreductase-domain-containing protein [Lyophyllum atratum]
MWHNLRNLLIRAAIRALRLFSPSIDALMKRIDQSPGLPVPGPSTPYWLMPESPIARHGAGEENKMPGYADVVIIGSGITGTSVARHYWIGRGRMELKVVMVEARETCSGATGRNGGHITPLLYAEYTGFKEKYGVETAKKIMRFRLAHTPNLLAVAAEEGLLEDSQCREVETFDVFHNPKLFNAAKAKLATYRADLPVESADFKVLEGEGVAKDLQLSDHTVGCLSTRAGAMHPYRLVTGILSRLLREYSSNFHLFTQTPCTAVSSPDGSSPGLYTVHTPKGLIQTPHVIHATNGWASHLLPGMRGKIIPARGVVTAQRAPSGIGESPAARAPGASSASSGSWTGTRSFVFFPDEGSGTYDYLTQQRSGSEEAKNGVDGTHATGYPPPAGEMMLGAVMGQGNSVLTELGCADDREWDRKTGEYLEHRLDAYFDVGDAKGEDRLKGVWGGILGVSADLMPWVGRIPSQVSGRCAPRTVGSDGGKKGSIFSGGSGVSSPLSGLAAPGEWMAAGYSGEGMVHAWMSGKALAHMVLGHDKETVGREAKGGSMDRGEDIEEWFPHVYRVSQERWRCVGIEDLVADSFLTD